MRKLPKLRDGRWALDVWRGLAEYANADDLAGNQNAALAVLEGFLCDADGRFELGEEKDGQTFEDLFLQEAIRHQPILRQLLYWLARPEEKTLIRVDNGVGRPPLMVGPVDFLNCELSDSSLRDASDPVCDGLEVYFARVVKFHSILGPICKFIEDELDGSWDQAPVRICEREGCGKFTVPERKGRKRFCSDRCRALVHQRSRSREARNAYMRNHRKVLAQRKRGKK